MKAINIIWDVDDPEELEGLPTEIEIPEGMTDEDDISDYLSDTTGFCHKGFSLDNDPDERTYIVTEVCPHCGAEVEIHGWDTDRNGFKAFCPYCGGRLMLCDECRHSECGDCNYDSVTDTCRHNPGVKEN